jgi:hypothetical protein
MKKPSKKVSPRLAAVMSVALMVMVTFHQNTAYKTSKPGMTKVLWAPCSDITGYPTVLTTTGAGDSATYDPATDYTFPTGKGFIDLKNELFKGSSVEWKNSGDEASPNWQVSVKGFIIGMDAQLIEQIKNMVGQPGVLLVHDADCAVDNMKAIGCDNNPCFVMFDGKTDFLNGSSAKGSGFEFKTPCMPFAYTGTPVMHT